MKKKQQIFFLSIMLFLCMVFAPPPKAQAQDYLPVDSIVLGIDQKFCPDGKSICVAIGDERYVQVIVYPWDATHNGLTYESMNMDIVTVEWDPMESWVVKLHTHSVGETDIIVRSLDSTYTDFLTVKIRVLDIQPGQLKLEPDELVIEQGDYQYVWAVVENPELGAYYTYTNKLKWTIKNDSYADVSDGGGAGMVTAKNIGTTIIKATTPNNVTAEGTVTIVRKPPGAPESTPMITNISGAMSFKNVDDDGYAVYEATISNTLIKIYCYGATGFKYTLDGTDPTAKGTVVSVSPSSLGSENITIRGKTTIRAVAYNSDPHYTVYGKECKVIILPKLDEPFIVCSSKKGVWEQYYYGDTIMFKTANTIPGIKIRYTLDGSEPTSSSMEYKKPIVVNWVNTGIYVKESSYPGISGKYFTLHIKVKAFCDGYEESKTFYEYRHVQYATPIINAIDGTISNLIGFTIGGCPAAVRYTLSDYFWVSPDETSTEYTGGSISKAGIQDFKYLKVAVFNKSCGKAMTSSTASCKYYNKSPLPEVTQFDFKTKTWIPRNHKTNYIVAYDDSIKFAVPDYPEAQIRYSDNPSQPASQYSGYWWSDTASYPIQGDKQLTARSFMKNNWGDLVTYKFNIMNKPPKPTIYPDNQIEAFDGTPMCVGTFEGYLNYYKYIMTDDGSDPYIFINKEGNVVMNGYFVDNIGSCYKKTPCYGSSTLCSEPLKIFKSGAYKAIEFARTPDGSFVMSDVEKKEYLVKPGDKEGDVENAEMDITISNSTGNSDYDYRYLGLLGKAIKFAVKAIGMKNDVVGDKKYLPACKNFEKELLAHERDTGIYKKVDNFLGLTESVKSFENDFKEMKDKFAKAIEYEANRKEVEKLLKPFEWNKESDGFSFNFKVAGLLKTVVVGKGKKNAQGVQEKDTTGIKGGFYLEMKTHAEVKEKFMVFIVPCEIKFIMDAGLTAGLFVTLIPIDNDGIRMKPETNLHMWLKAHLGLSIGVPFLAKAEVNADGMFDLYWKINQDKHKFIISGRIWAEGTFLGITKTVNFVNPGQPWTVLDDGYGPTKSSDSSDFFLKNITDFTKILDPASARCSGWKIIPRNYLATQSEWLGSTPPERDGSPFRVLQKSIYSETEPKIAEGGGKRVMVFLADDATRDDYNRSRLMSSVYNSATDTWSDPVPVNNNGKADFHPCIASNGTDIWVAWQNSKTTFDPNSTMEEMFAAGEIALAKFNPATNKFNTTTMLTNNSIADAAPKLTVTPSGALYITWLQNASNDPFSTTQTNKIMEARHNGETVIHVGEVTSVQGTIYDLDIAWFNSKALIAYTTLGDNKEDNVRNFYTIELGTTTPQKLVSNKIVSGVRYGAVGNTKVLSWLEESKLRYLPQGGTPQSMVDSADMYFENYKIFTNGTKTAVVYPRLDGDFGYLYARNVESGKMGNPYKLANTTGVPHKFDGKLENNGEFFIVYNSCITDFVDDEIVKENNFMTFRSTEPVNLKLKYLDYSQEEVKLGKPLKVKLDIANIGGVTVNNVVVKVNGTAAGTYPLNLKPGEEKTIDFNMNIPTTMTPRTNFTITIEPAGMTDFDMNDNSSDITLGFVNFTMGVITEYKSGNIVTLTADITNQSDYAANTKLVVRHDDGPVLDVIEIGNFAPRAKKTYKFDYDLDDICPSGETKFLRFNLISDKDATFNCYHNVLINNNTYTIPYDSFPSIGIKEFPIPTVFDSNSVLVYPNPTTGEVKVMIVGQVRDEVNIDNVDVYDMFGRKILTHTPHPTPHTSFNVAHLQAGIYFLRVQTDRDLVVKKLIKY